MTITFYYNPSPNPAKVALFLEETGLRYEAVPIDVAKGEQFSAAFLALNPNAKIPVVVTESGETVFDSSAILLFLAQKTGQFLPAELPGTRAELLSWLMFAASGIGPYSGQAVHFRHFAPEPKDYPANRYAYEAQRHWRIVDARLERSRYMLGDAYTIVDMAIWGWGRSLAFVMGEAAAAEFPNVKRLIDEINARPAAMRVNALFARHQFKREFDEEARGHMFPHNRPASGLVSGAG
jgi:GSH-dependent disulfide-bond oxidoreductase